MEGSDNTNSKRLVWVVIGVAIFACIAVSIILYVLFGAPTEELPADTSTEQPVASKNQVEQNLTDLGSDIKQSVDDQKAAEAALNDDSKRIELGN